MEVDKSIMLQKQVRDNSQDLHSEFLDMKNWEDQMKKADSEIRKASGDQILPPIRKKKKAPKETQQQRIKENSEKSKRIKSSDYSAWDKFDVEKACESVDKKNDSSDSEEEPLSKEELEKNHAEATEHKVEGNVFVQQQQWAKAIGCYNKAIKAFPYDAVFFANRALCHLKIDNFHSAESDCTAAIQLDESYVKAYHRRATARIELKQYKEAAEDIKKILKLEPTNKEAQSLLARVNKSIDKSKTLMSSTRPQVNKKIEKELAAGTPDDNKSNTNSEKPKKASEMLMKKLSAVEAKDKENLAVPEQQVEVEESRLPDWLPENHEDVGIVQVIKKAPHQRSKKPLRTVPIEEIEFGEKNPSSKNPPAELSKKSPVCDSKKDVPSPGTVETKATCEEVPEAPKTSVQFLSTWRKNKSTEFRHKYFKQIPAERIPTLFQDSMESNTFSEILKVLRLEFAKREEPVFDYLRYLSQVKRFRTLTMFMSKSDKEDLKMLFHYSQKVEHQRDDVVKDLLTAYEI